MDCSANDICKESRRQIVNAEDVFNALDEIQFSDLVSPLKASLDGTLTLYYSICSFHCLLHFHYPDDQIVIENAAF